MESLDKYTKIFPTTLFYFFGLYVGIHKEHKKKPILIAKAPVLHLWRGVFGYPKGSSALPVSKPRNQTAAEDLDTLTAILGLIVFRRFRV